MEDRKQERYEEKMQRYEENKERREERHEIEEERHRTPWYASGKFWLYVGVAVLCAILIYWVLFIAIWDGPNQ